MRYVLKRLHFHRESLQAMNMIFRLKKLGRMEGIPMLKVAGLRRLAAAFLFFALCKVAKKPGSKFLQPAVLLRNYYSRVSSDGSLFSRAITKTAINLVVHQTSDLQVGQQVYTVHFKDILGLQLTVSARICTHR